MTLSVITKYQLRNVRLSLTIFCGIMVAVVAILAVLARSVSDTVNFSSMEASAGIFAFVCAMNSFKENFGFALQNGVSRKTLFRSTLIMALCFSALLCVLDQLLHLFTLLVSQGAGNMRWFRLTEALYDTRYAGAPELQRTAENIVFNFTLYTALFMTGYMITIAYYRMSRWLKLLISIGVPALVVVVYPLVDLLLLQGADQQRPGPGRFAGVGHRGAEYLDRRAVPDAAGGGHGRRGLGDDAAGRHQELAAQGRGKKKKAGKLPAFCLPVSCGRSR